MIAKPIIKLIDESIIPALLLVVAKMIGILTAILFYKLPFEIEYYSFLYVGPSIKFTSLDSYIRAENLSNVFLFTASAIGAAIVLIRLHLFHETHVHPKVHSKLAFLNLETLILPSYHLYHQAFIWLLYTWLCAGFLLTSALSKITYLQTAVIALIIVINFSWIMAKDVEKEINLKKVF